MSYDLSGSAAQRNIVLPSFAAVDHLLLRINGLSVPATSEAMLLCWCDAKSSSQRIHFIQISPLWQSFALCSVRRRFRLNTFMASVRAAASIVCYLGEARANNQLTLLATERSPFCPSHYICSHVHSQPLDMTGLINRSSSVTAADLFEIQMHTISIRPTLKMWVLKTLSINLSELAAGIVVYFDFMKYEYYLTSSTFIFHMLKF